MPIVTSLKPQKNNKRVNVYVDNKFGFGIDLENLVKFGIKTNQEFTSEQLNKIIKEAEFQKTYDKLLRFVTPRPRSEKEVDMWFNRKKIAESLFAGLKAKLSKLGLLDDKAFARWWIEQRLSYRPRGKRALTSELMQKGIERKLIDKLLLDTKVDEMKIAQKLLERKSRSWERYDSDQKKQKQMEFLARRGFGWELIKKLTGRGWEE